MHPISSAVREWSGSSLQEFHVLKLQANEVFRAMKILVALGMAACAFRDPSSMIRIARTVLLPNTSFASRFLSFPAC